MKNIFSKFLVILLQSTAIMLSSCGTSSISLSESSHDSVTDSASIPNPPSLVSKVHIFSIPSGVDIYPDATAKIENTNLPIYNVKTNNDHIFAYEPVRQNNGVIIFQLEGAVQIDIQTNYALDASTRILPSIYNIVPSHDLVNRTISFEIYNPGFYTVEPNQDAKRTIHIFVDTYQDSVDENSLGDNVIYFGPGLHTAASSPYIDENNQITLQSEQTVFIDYGAVVRGKIYANQVTNVKVLGGGIIDGSSFLRQNVVVPLNIERSRYIEISGITFLDPAAWTCNLYFSRNATIDNIKIITSRANGDGITLQSCQDIAVTHCFVRGFDDNLVVKNYHGPYGTPVRDKMGETRNISFRYCTLWTDLAQSMEIGYETVGDVLDNVIFSDNIVLRTYQKSVASIHNANYATVTNIQFNNTTVEYANMGGGNIIEIQNLYSSAFSDNPAGGATEIGEIDGVEINNFLVKKSVNTNNLSINITGFMDSRTAYLNRVSLVKNVDLIDVQFLSTVVDPSFEQITTNQFVQNFSVSNSGQVISGASVIRSWTKEQLTEYRQDLIIMID